MRHLIKVALTLLACVASFYVYGFTALVAPWYVALGAASSLVGTYIGLAFADIPPEQRNKAMGVATAAMIIEALYGVLYVLSVQSPEVFRAPLSLWLSVPLAFLHGAAFSVMAFCVSVFVVHEQRVRGMADHPTMQIVPPPLLEDEHIRVGARLLSLRQLARLTGTPLSTLRRQLKEEEE